MKRKDNLAKCVEADVYKLLNNNFIDADIYRLTDNIKKKGCCRITDNSLESTTTIKLREKELL